MSLCVFTNLSIKSLTSFSVVPFLRLVAITVKSDGVTLATSIYLLTIFIYLLKLYWIVNFNMKYIKLVSYINDPIMRRIVHRKFKPAVVFIVSLGLFLLITPSLFTNELESHWVLSEQLFPLVFWMMLWIEEAAPIMIMKRMEYFIKTKYKDIPLPKNPNSFRSTFKLIFSFSCFEIFSTMGEKKIKKVKLITMMLPQHKQISIYGLIELKFLMNPIDFAF